jgi:hypothetical protein
VSVTGTVTRLTGPTRILIVTIPWYVPGGESPADAVISTVAGVTEPEEAVAREELLIPNHR